MEINRHKLIKTIFITAAALVNSTSIANVAVTENFETPEAFGYSQGLTPVGWVRATQGYGAGRHGLSTDHVENAESTANRQGYAFRYGRTGITTDTGRIGSLVSGATYTVSFDIQRDNANNGLNYHAQLIAFADGAPRTKATAFSAESTLLAETTGKATEDGQVTRQIIEFTPVEGEHDAEFDKDVALRFRGSFEGNAVIDNITIEITGAGEIQTGAEKFLQNITLLTNNLEELSLSDAEIDAATRQIVSHSLTTPEEISALFEFVTSYETAYGGLFVQGSHTDGGWKNRATTPTNIHWAAFQMMQYIVDHVYTASNISDFEAVFDGFKFTSANFFPGSVNPPEERTTHNTKIKASYVVDGLRKDQLDRFPARKPTGTYAAPGSLVVVEVPAEMVGRGYQIRVGGHSRDTSQRPKVRRLDRVSVVFDITQNITTVANPLGGGVYIEVPIDTNYESEFAEISITGAVRSPYFSAKSFHQTSDEEWQSTERNHNAPWADFQTEKFMMMLPTDWVSLWDNPKPVLEEFDQSMDIINELMGYPADRGKETMFSAVDVIQPTKNHAPGYPAVNVLYFPNKSNGGTSENYLVKGVRNSPTYFFHERGHAYLFPKFSGENESTVNLLQVAVLNRLFDVDLEQASAASTSRKFNSFISLDNTAVAWMTSFNFSDGVAMQAGEKSYQLKGQAKFIELIKLFGWEPLNQFWTSFVSESSPNKIDDDTRMLKLSTMVGKDVRPLFEFWGTFPTDPEALEVRFSAAGIEQSDEIKNRLCHYRSLVPTNNLAFREFTENWWNHPPKVKANWTQSEHARQYDETPHWQTQGKKYRGLDVNEKDGEIYNEARAEKIMQRIDSIVNKHYGGC